MKTIFIIFLLISTSTIISSTVTLDKQQSDFIDLINVVRHKVAKYYNIINMHKLLSKGIEKQEKQRIFSRPDEKPKNSCMNGFKFDETGLCVKSPPQTPSATTVNPNNNSNVLPISETPETQTHYQTNHSNPTNLNPTPPRPKNPESSSSRKTKLSPETATLPKELEDYVEVDGDDYDEDFPTGEPPLDSGYENLLQFWITVVFVLGFCFLV